MDSCGRPCRQASRFRGLTRSSAKPHRRSFDTAAPVSGVKVSIRTTDNKVFWTGTTDEHGIVVAPNTDLRAERKELKPDAEEYVNEWQALSDLHFIVVAEKDGDIAYAASNWNDGVQPWEFGTSFNLAEAVSLLRGQVFTDRGVYKLGEEVHFKAVVRGDTPTGVQLLPPQTAVDVSMTNGRSISTSGAARNGRRPFQPTAFWARIR
ncbi:MAG: hypothetical protein DMF59_04445 [Acidobacteria bacterium]|nr:MAG: hypothetical protein DMF59_04445 [Acidobacteriota bacterium]